MIVERLYTLDDAKLELARLAMRKTLTGAAATWSPPAIAWARGHLLEHVPVPLSQHPWSMAALTELGRVFGLTWQEGPHTPEELLIGGLVCELLTADRVGRYRVELGLVAGGHDR